LLVYLDVALDQALERNALRPNKVPESVIVEMAERFDRPAQFDFQLSATDDLNEAAAQILAHASALGPDAALARKSTGQQPDSGHTDKHFRDIERRKWVHAQMQVAVAQGAAEEELRELARQLLREQQ
jgi:tRNA uridine 5-carbamoylmethylation protein Kti12